MMIDSYSLFSRFLHWGFALCFAVAYISSEGFPFYMHLIAGLGFLSFLILKYGWMFTTTDLSNIRWFHFAGLMEFVKGIAKMHKKEQNHNPLSSWVSVSIVVSATFTIISGFLFLYDKEFWFVLGHDIKEVHELFANLTLFAVGLHVAGVISDALVFKHKTYRQMLVGSSNIDRKAVIGVIGFGALCGAAFWIYGIFSSTPPQIKNSIYEKECASCHFAYPKELYSAKSWQNIMANLDKHYGDSAELEDVDGADILSYLINGAESKKMSAVFGEFEIDGIEQSIVTLEKFKRIHRHLPKEDLKPACQKCHIDASTGAFRLANIRPKKEESDDKNNSN